METRIENASITLLDKLFEIEEKCFNEEAFSKQQIAYLLKDYNTIALAAKADSETAGFIIAQVEVEDNTLFGHIVTVNVSPSYRRKGIASKMLQEIENTLRDRGISECRLEVRENNSAALKLYEKNRYVKMGRIERYYGRTHGIYLKKSL